ncbi:MAG: dihydropteroate synthase [Chloroflexi bacterium]|nr:dihydropteroate synthase [Chloroflexota bacterium]
MTQAMQQAMAPLLERQGCCLIGEKEDKVILAGNLAALTRLAIALRNDVDTGLGSLGEELYSALEYGARRRYVSPTWTVRGTVFRWGERTYVMGIINVTPDSFSGDGLLAGAITMEETVERAVRQALDFVRDGADLIDVGGESTRPGGAPVDAETELKRVVPVIERLRAETEVPISIDTYKAEVAAAALDAGADIVNDVWGLRMDPELAPLVAERGVPVVIMHNRSRPRDAAQEERLGGRYVGIHYEDLLADICRELREQVAAAIAAGIAPERILIDPGIGFGKTVEQNLALLNHSGQLRALGLPILLGPSRKSFIGYTLNLPQDQRLEGTAAAVALGIARGGADMVRVHDVQAMVRVARMVDAIIRAH